MNADNDFHHSETKGLTAREIAELIVNEAIIDESQLQYYTHEIEEYAKRKCEE